MFSQLLHQEQGPVLKKLSDAVAPALVALATDSLPHEMLFPIECTDMALLRSLPKGLLGGLENLF